MHGCVAPQQIQPLEFVQALQCFWFILQTPLSTLFLHRTSAEDSHVAGKSKSSWDFLSLQEKEAVHGCDFLCVKRSSLSVISCGDFL